MSKKPTHKVVKAVKKAASKAKKVFEGVPIVETKTEGVWQPLSVLPTEGLVVDIETSGGVEPGRHIDGNWRTLDGKGVGITRWRYR